MMTISISDILYCYKKPSWVNSLTPERVKHICGDKYHEYFEYYDHYWRPEELEEDISLFGKEYVESIYAGDYSKVIKKTNIYHYIDYDIVRFTFYKGGRSTYISIKTFDHSSNIIHRLKLADYDRFCKFTLKDFVNLLTDAGKGYFINDPLASEKFISMYTISDSDLPIEPTFHWVDGKWKLRYIGITTDCDKIVT